MWNAGSLAQNNPFKIKDELYKYYQVIDANIQSDKVLGMTDTLFEMAKKDGDVKAQCLALYSRQRHYHSIGDFKAEKEEFHRVAPFILKTPYHQYYFGMWYNIILRNINDKNTLTASNDIQAFRNEAMKLKNDYGVFQSYILQGSLFSISGHYRIALTYYNMALEYSKKTGVNDNKSIYIHLARCCFYLTRWDDCQKYLAMIFKEDTGNSFTTRTYAINLSCQCNRIPMDSVQVETAYAAMMNSQKKYPILKNDEFMMEEALYYYYKYYKKNLVKAETYHNAQSIPVYFDYMQNAIQYEKEKDYKNACIYYEKYLLAIREINRNDELFLIDDFVPQLDYYNVEHEKTSLDQRNEQMKLKTLKNSQDILRLLERGAEGRLITNQRLHNIQMNRYNAQEALIGQQNRMLKMKMLQSEQQKKTASLITEKEKWRLIFVLASTITLALAVFLYAMAKLKKRTRLKKEREKAEKTSRIKSLFFQNMNHEIRNPLNAISGFNDVLNGDMSATLSHEDKKEFIGMITMNSDLLMTLVNDVIDLSNYETGTYRLHFTDVDIDRLCNTTVESIRGRQKDGVELQFQPGNENGCTLHTDAQRLQQVLTNYLTNACKHTESGSITLTYEILADTIRFSVTDTGCGVKDEDADRVFERFQMAGKMKDGTGLGLHICRLIAGLLHGKVYLDKNYKKGARFIFDHPKIMTLLIALVLSFSSIIGNADNKKGLHAKFVEMYTQLEFNYYTEEGLAEANELYKMAVNAHDVEAQCMALVSKYSYYMIRRNNKMAEPLFQECMHLSTTSGKYVYAFDCLVNKISVEMQDQKYEEAKEGLVDLYQLANKHNDKYGLGAYYYAAGNFYYVQRQYGAALFYYLQAADNVNNNNEAIYCMIGSCYYAIGNYSKAETSLKKSLESIPNDLNIINPMVKLEKLYCLQGKNAEATEVFKELSKIKVEKLDSVSKGFYHYGMFQYYKHIAKNNEKADGEEGKVLGSSTWPWEQAQIQFEKGNYEKALSLYKKIAMDEQKWLTTDYDRLNDFYVNKFDYRESKRNKDLLELSAISLKVKEARNSHDLLTLKHERTAWLLRQDELKSKEKQGRLELQQLQLAQKKQEYQKQFIQEQGWKKQNDIQMERMKWKTLSLGVFGLIFLAGVFLLLKHLHKSEKEFMNEAEKAKETEERKSRFFDSINREIREPIDRIISLNKRLNEDGESSISDEERKEGVTELHETVSHLTEFINDVLLISKLESGSYQVRQDICDMGELCSQALAMLKSFGNIEYKPAKSGLRIFTSDSVMIPQAISSMLQFALCNTESKDTILMTSDTDNNMLTMTVTFPGEPFLEKEAETLFEFGAKTEKQSPEYIGMHKCKLIAETLNGKVYADTTWEKGKKLVMKIPIGASDLM